MIKPPQCVCGARYEDHKTGYTYGEVRRMLWVSSDDPSQWQSKGKAAVFRLWHQLKRDEWYALHGHCKRDFRPQRYIARQQRQQRLEHMFGGAA